MLRTLSLLLASVGLAAAAPVTVYVELGKQASAVDDWSGSIDVRGGDLLRIESRHFMPTDRLTGPNSWEATTRREQIDGFARMNYNEMSPAHLPPTQFSPVGVFAVIEDAGAGRVEVQTEQGDFAFALSNLGPRAVPFLDGRAQVSLLPPVQKVSTEIYEDDEAAVAALSDGRTAVGWIGYKDRADRVFVRTRSGEDWGAIEEVSETPGDFWRCSLAVDSEGALWVFWSARSGPKWDIFGRRKSGDSWGPVEQISREGSNTFHRAATGDGGEVYLVWQSFRDPGDPDSKERAQSDIVLRSYRDGKWSDETLVSASKANDWEPYVAAGPNGSAYVVWDGYEEANYDVFFRAFEGGEAQPIEQITDSERFQAHATVAVDHEGRPWVAWDESGVNWGKDQGYLITPPMSVPLHQERSLRLVMRDGSAWKAPKKELEPFYVYQLYPNFENPQIAFDGDGVLTMVFRHWTRQRAHSIGARIQWENFVTRFDGRSWTTPAPLPHSMGSIEKRPALAVDASGDVHAAWMTDNRTFADALPQNSEIYYASLGRLGSAPHYAPEVFDPFDDAFAEALPIHPDESENVAAIRDHVVQAGAKRYKIYRGDMHRHTDVSQDFKYDGSLIEVYRYALDAAAFDYIVPTDHQLGYDQEFTWWQDEKLADLFHVPGTFAPMFGYERSLTFPNGHRNVIFAKRGTRTLPIGEAERKGEARTGPILFPYLKANDGISMPHSSGTSQGTDFADNDPDVEPLLEIFQGYRASYEYLGAPLAADYQKLREQRSGFNPLGYYWNALEKGYKMGVQASSDHWSTHISYAMIVAEDFTRDSMFEAIKKRHAYAATDNIILDFQAESDGKAYIMGDIIDSDEAPVLNIKAVGTDRIKQLVIIKNQQIIYTRHPNADSVTLRYRDADFQAGSNYYYVRVVQNNGMVAWSSPIWVE